MAKYLEQQEYENRIGRTLISEEQIKKRIAEVGKMIDESYDGKPILLLSILKGLSYLWRIFVGQ